MKKLLLLPGLFIALNTAAQECAPYIGEVSLAWGYDLKGTKYIHMEAGIWGTEKPVTISVGIAAWAKIEDTTGYNQPNFIPGTRSFAGLYLRVGSILYRSRDRRIFGVASLTLSRRPTVNLAAYYKPFNQNNILIGLIPFYHFSDKTPGAWLQFKFGI